MVQNEIKTFSTAINLGVSSKSQGEVAWEDDEIRYLEDLLHGDDAKPVGRVICYFELGVDKATIPSHPPNEVWRGDCMQASMRGGDLPMKRAR